MWQSYTARNILSFFRFKCEPLFTNKPWMPVQGSSYALSVTDVGHTREVALTIICLAATSQKSMATCRCYTLWRVKIRWWLPLPLRRDFPGMLLLKKSFRKMLRNFQAHGVNSIFGCFLLECIISRLGPSPTWSKCLMISRLHLSPTWHEQN